MAQRPKFRKSSTLLPRILSAAVLIPLCLYVIYKGPPYSLVLGGLVTLGLFIEWGILLLKCPFPPVSKTVYSILGMLYLGVATFWLLQTMALSDGWPLLYWLLLLVWSTDTAAYTGGKIFKGLKLAPSLSPNKTWSGFFTGMTVGVAVSYGISAWVFPGVFSFWGIVCLVFIAQGGDLLESQAKRWSHVKDSGSLIPGHGGLLDRLDSLMAVSFALALWQMVF